MKKQTFGLLLDQLIFQINSSMISLNKVIDLYKQNRKIMKQRNLEEYKPEDEFWIYLHSYAISLSNIAKLFHPTGILDEKEFKRREENRRVFVEQFASNSNDLMKKYKHIANKDLRNSLEHIDQRIEDFGKNDGIFLSLNRKIVPIDLLEGIQKVSLKVNGRIAKEKILNVSSLESFFYDPENDDNDVYSAFGSDLRIQDTFLELDAMKEKAVEIMNKYNSGKLDILFD